MVKVGFIVEGDSEKVIIESPQFKSWLSSKGIELITPVLNAAGGGNLLPKNIEPLIERFTSLNVDHIFVLTDLEQEPDIQTVRNRIENPGLRFIFVAVKALEAWYLADTEAMKKWLKVTDFNEEFPENTVDMPWDRLKEISQQLDKTGPGGSKVSFAKRMIKHFGFQVSRSAEHLNCDSAKEFIRELESLSTD